MEYKKGKWYDSIRTRIFLIMALIIFPLNILVIVGTYQAIDAVKEQAYITMESISNLYIQEIDDRVGAIHYYLYELEENDVDFITISEQNRDDAYYLSQTNLVRKFMTNINTQRTADGYFYFAMKADDLQIALVANDTESANELREELTKWIKQKNYPKRRVWIILNIANQNLLLQLYQDDGFYYGGFILLDDYSAIIEKSVDFPELSVIASMEEVSDVSKSHVNVVSDASRTGLKLYLSVPSSIIVGMLPLMEKLFIALAFIYILLIPIIFVLLDKMLLKPLRRIQSAMTKMKDGEQGYRISFHRYAKEFRVINQSFNEMADNIETLKIVNYEKEISRRKMELKNLQLQIRPHFLLNTFNLVYSLAQIKDFKSIQKLALYLSDYFRYIFRSGKELETFDQEYELIKKYLEISAIRYPDAYEVTYDVGDEVLNVPIPPLLIHNFVENIINHALIRKRTIKIEVSAHYDDGWAEFIVKDDGCGMDEEKVESINSGDFHTKSGKRISVGLANSYQRILYFYGDKSTMKVDSEINKGTQMTVRFPITMPEEEAANEFTDS